MTSAASSINLAGVLNTTHENKWVALTPDYARALGAADSLPDLLDRIAEAFGIDRPRRRPHAAMGIPMQPAWRR